MKILDVYWFTSFKDGSFGIVKIQNEADEIKYYIGFAGYGKTEEESIDLIVRLGCPFFPESMKEFLNL